MKKKTSVLALMLVLLLCVGVFAGCADKTENEGTTGTTSGTTQEDSSAETGTDASDKETGDATDGTAEDTTGATEGTSSAA